MGRNKKAVFIAGSGLLFCALALVSLINYTPPLIDKGPCNPLGKIHDCIAYAWYYSRLLWHQNSGDPTLSRRESASAVWYRPDQAMKLLGVSPDDFIGLARIYLNVGLRPQARQLLIYCADRQQLDAEKGQELISYLQLFHEWSVIKDVAKNLLGQGTSKAEIAYWYGRALVEVGSPTEGIDYLKQAFSRQEGLADALYWIGKAEEKIDEGTRALERYHRTVRLMPNHYQAWEALSRIARERGDENAHEEAEAHARELKPTVETRGTYENKVALIGTNMSQSVLKTDGLVCFDIYAMGLTPRSLKLRPELRWMSESTRLFACRDANWFNLPPTGAVAKYAVSIPTPFLLPPGDYSLELAFMEGGSERKLFANDRGDEYLPVSKISLIPDWIPAHFAEQSMIECFGLDSKAVEQRTYLGPGSQVELIIDDPIPVAELGFISFGHRIGTLANEQLIAQATLSSKQGEEFVFPIRAGIETSDCWWEGAQPHRRYHNRARVFRSWPAVHRGNNFMAHEYAAVFRLPFPIELRSVKINYSAADGGLCICGMVLIPRVTSDLPGQTDPGVKSSSIVSVR